MILIACILAALATGLLVAWDRDDRRGSRMAHASGGGAGPDADDPIARELDAALDMARREMAAASAERPPPVAVLPADGMPDMSLAATLGDPPESGPAATPREIVDFDPATDVIAISVDDPHRERAFAIELAEDVTRILLDGAVVARVAGHLTIDRSHIRFVALPNGTGSAVA